jgi:hypothetical protein
MVKLSSLHELFVFPKCTQKYGMHLCESCAAIFGNFDEGTLYGSLALLPRSGVLYSSEQAIVGIRTLG